MTYNQTKIHYYRVRLPKKSFFIFLGAISLASYKKTHNNEKNWKKKKSSHWVPLVYPRNTLHFDGRNHTATAVFTPRRNPFWLTRRRRGKSHLPDNRKNVDSYSTSGYTAVVCSRVGGSSNRCRCLYVCVCVLYAFIYIYVFFLKLFLLS